MDQYMKSLPRDTAPDPYAGIPVCDAPAPDALGEQELKL